MKAFLFALALVALLSGTAQASTFRVDDSGSQVLRPSVNMKWDDDTAGLRRGVLPSGVTGQLPVLVRLNVQPWQGKMGRIYMTMPPIPAGPMTATWTTQGRLLPGALRSGERALVYQGIIGPDVLEDTFLITLQADGNQLVRSERLEFSFEIDVDSP